MEPQLINYLNPKMIETLRNTVARDLTDSEFQLFTEICKSSGLNPFKKEVWAIKAGGRLQVMTGINGYMAIANNHPQFDGMEIDVEMKTDRPFKATCKVHRKDRKFPSTGVALMAEFGKSSPIWVQMPTVMLTKVAKCIALREAFCQELNGTYAEEEMPREYEAPKIVSDKIALEKIGPYFYEIKHILAPQQEYLEGQGAFWNSEKTCWESPTKLDKKLDKFLVPLSEIADGLSSWHVEANAQKTPVELPLDRIKRRVADIAKGTQAELEIESIEI